MSFKLLSISTHTFVCYPPSSLLIEPNYLLFLTIITMIKTKQGCLCSTLTCCDFSTKAFSKSWLDETKQNAVKTRSICKPEQFVTDTTGSAGNDIQALCSHQTTTSLPCELTAKPCNLVSFKYLTHFVLTAGQIESMPKTCLT